MVRAVVLCLAVALLVPTYADERGVTTQPEPTSPAEAGRKAATHPPCLIAPEPQPSPSLLPSDTGWTLVDSLSLHAMIPAGRRLAVVFDSAGEVLRDTLLPEFLTAAAREAVALAPTWLQDDLADNFRRLNTVNQDVYADLIVNCPDKRYYDELCFVIAHLAPTSFNGLVPRLLLDNARFLYQIDRELQYVDIVDYGDPLRGGDYYSTTRYRAIVGGDTTLVEIPRDMYYWWVVMPKGTDEPPAYVLGYFWREYLFYNCDSGYPLLREKLANTRILWNGERGWWAGVGQPFDDTLPAVAVVGRWCAQTVPFPAQGNRPIQPVQIAHEHDGNCGETQDVLWAAARTALIPCGGVMDINEDHVWCEIWWQGEFHPWQVDLGGGPTNIKNPGVAYDRKYGGGKSCSGIWDWRNDGWQRSVTGTYSDVCTLTVEVRDSVLRPVDGAQVRLSSEDWYGGMAACFNGATGRDGRYTTTLGDLQNYYLVVDGPLGRIDAGRIIDSVDAAPGTHFFYACTLAGRLESLDVTPDSGAPLDWYRLDVSYSSGREVLYGSDCYNSGGPHEYALTSSPGLLDFFITRQSEFERYLSGTGFRAFDVDENASAANHSFVLPSGGNWYSVFSNEEQADVTEFVDAVVRLYRRGVDIVEARAAGTAWVSVGPSPCRGELRILLSGSAPLAADMCIVDVAGRLVRVGSRVRNERVVAWDGLDQRGEEVRPGVYFCRVAGAAGAVPFIWLGR